MIKIGHDDTDGANVKVIRDKRGRLAVSRPSERPRKATPSRTPSTPSIITAASINAGNKDSDKKNPSKESVKETNPQQPKPADQNAWGPAEDRLLIQLRSEKKSWDYIAGRLDGKGKDLGALKAHFNQLGLQNLLGTPKGDGKGMTENKGNGTAKNDAQNEKKGGPPGEKGMKQHQKAKGEEPSEKGSPKGSILKNSMMGGNFGTNGIPGPGQGYNNAQNMAFQNIPAQPTAQKMGYIGKHGRGEVRFFNGVAVLHRYAGTNAEPLNAESVALISREISKYDRSKWVTITSRLFDKTGIHMDPDVVRVAFGG